MNKLSNLVTALVITSLLFAVGCKKDNKNNGNNSKNVPPTCTITNPQDNAPFTVNMDISIMVVAADEDGTIVEVQLFIDNVAHSVKKELPYNFTINAGELSEGAHTLKAVAKDNENATGESSVNIEINPILFTLGDSYGGGIIFYIDGTGKHGLIAATEDQNDGIIWSENYAVTGSSQTAIGTGQSNTAKIVQELGDAYNYAAKLCDNLELNGYNDWFLPSKDELHTLYMFYVQNETLIGGFAEARYWSSSEIEENANSANAWCHWFRGDIGNPSNPIANFKSSKHRVRAIRTF
jgi:hypothetical protein